MTLRAVTPSGGAAVRAPRVSVSHSPQPATRPSPVRCPRLGYLPAPSSLAGARTPVLPEHRLSASLPELGSRLGHWTIRERQGLMGRAGQVVRAPRGSQSGSPLRDSTKTRHKFLKGLRSPAEGPKRLPCSPPSRFPSSSVSRTGWCRSAPSQGWKGCRRIGLQRLV